MKISNKIKLFAASAALACGSVVCLASAPSYADIDCGTNSGFTYDTVTHTCVPNDGPTTDLWGTVSTIINWVLAIVGVIATFMIIIGGIQYSTSAGDSGKVKKAKDTILYGIIGLVISLLAAAIVNFVLSGIFSSSNGDDDDDDASVSTIYIA